MCSRLLFQLRTDVEGSLPSTKHGITEVETIAGVLTDKHRGANRAASSSRIKAGKKLAGGAVKSLDEPFTLHVTQLHSGESTHRRTGSQRNNGDVTTGATIHTKNSGWRQWGRVAA